jgi:predicted RNA-binding protein with PUA-like domain
MSFWLLKTEPGQYSYANLVSDSVAEWDGVTAPPAQANMRKMVPGDTCVIYHTGSERAAVGLASVERGPYPDPADQTGRRVLVDVRATEPLSRPVPLAALRTSKPFAGSPLLRMGRLSVVPLTQSQYEELLKLSRQAGPLPD